MPQPNPVTAAEVLEDEFRALRPQAPGRVEPGRRAALERKPPGDRHPSRPA